MALLDWCPACMGRGYIYFWDRDATEECRTCGGLGVCDERDIDNFVRVRRPDRATDASVDEPR